MVFRQSCKKLSCLFVRYCFLAFNFDERVVADKESCRLLLLRLKLDGWALGKTKVFLRYYHIEYLAKLCEQQVYCIQTFTFLLSLHLH